MVLPPAEERDDADQLVIDMLQTDITERVLLSHLSVGGLGSPKRVSGSAVYIDGGNVGRSTLQRLGWSSDTEAS